MAILAPPAGKFYRLFYRWNRAVGVKSLHTNVRSSTNIYSGPSWPIHCTKRRKTTTLAEQRYASSSSPAQQPRSTRSTPDSCTDNSNLPTLMRRLMRRIPHPVVILTAMQPDLSPVDQTTSPAADSLRGMAVSSFTTVCLEPRPIVSFNMKLPSRTYDAVKANGGFFLVHFLSGSAQAAALADGFTRGQEEVKRLLGGAVGDVPSGAGKSAAGREGDGNGSASNDISVGFDAPTRSSPVISGPAVTHVLRCRQLENRELHIEDHVVLCAEVQGLLGPDEEVLEQNAEEELSLIYVNQKFRHVGNAIE